MANHHTDITPRSGSDPIIDWVYLEWCSRRMGKIYYIDVVIAQQELKEMRSARYYHKESLGRSKIKAALSTTLLP